LVEDERPNCRISPSNWEKINYSNRCDTTVIVPEHRSALITAGHRRATFWTPHASRESLGRSRGGLTCKIHLAADRRCRPISRVTTAGHRHDRRRSNR
jgi:hypothetical protein